MIKKSRVKHGSTRSYWVKYYADKYNKGPTAENEQLAIWYLILFEALGDED